MPHRIVSEQRTPRGGRLHLRVALQADALVSWGYRRRRCAVTEFSPGGLTVRDLDAEEGTPVAIELPLPDGTFTVCGVVVHRAGAHGAAGIRYVALTADLRLALESYLWDLLAASALPGDPRRCSVAGCGRAHKARGYCSLHYSRWRRDSSRALSA